MFKFIKEFINEVNKIPEELFKDPSFETASNIIRTGTVDDVLRYLDSGYDLNIHDPETGESLLSEFLCMSLYDKKKTNTNVIVQLLLGRGANPNYRGRSSWNKPPIYHAVYENNYETVVILIENGASINEIIIEHDSAIYNTPQVTSIYDRSIQSSIDMTWPKKRPDKILFPDGCPIPNGCIINDDDYLALIKEYALKENKQEPKIPMLLRKLGAKSTKEMLDSMTVMTRADYKDPLVQ